MCDSALDLLPQTVRSKRWCQNLFSGDKTHKKAITRTPTSFYMPDGEEDSTVRCCRGKKRNTGDGEPLPTKELPGMQVRATTPKVVHSQNTNSQSFYLVL